MSHTCPLCGAALGADAGSGTFCPVCSRTAHQLSHFLETLDSPAALIARDHTILLANNLLRRMLQADRDSRGLRIGEAIGCKYAEPNDACGEAHACYHCALKRLIELSRITGERLSGLPLSVRQKSGADHSFRLSTEKTGEAILLEAARTNLDAVNFP